MLIVLIFCNGPEAGRKIRVRPNQVVTIGSTEWADFAVRGDPRMAEVHFQLTSDHEKCQLHDLRSGAGTLVNGRPISSCVLSNGDVITAGSTQFEVQIENDATPRPADPLPKPAAGVPVLPGGARYERVRVSQRMDLLRGQAAERAPLELIQLVAQRHPAHLLIDFRRAGVEPLPQAQAGPDLLARLPESLRGGRSLHRVPFSEHSRELAAQAWGKDAVICLFSSAEAERVEQIVWSSLGAFLRPAFLRQQLQQPGRLGTLLASIAAVFVEVEGTAGWELYRNPAVALSWNDLGLTLP